jgi:hypothetical protein
VNKFTNILLILIFFPTMFLVIVVGFDIPLDILKTTGANLPYKMELFYSFAGITFIVAARRSIRRWMGVKLVNQIDKFKWNRPIGNERMRQVNLYLMLEVFVSVFISFAVFQLTELAWSISLVYIIFAIDHLMFSILGKTKKLFRVGVTSKAIVIADRDVKVLYFSGLRKISVQQQSVFFDYLEDLQISFPANCIADEDKSSFKQTIEKFVNRDKVYFSNNFKEF